LTDWGARSRHTPGTAARAPAASRHTAATSATSARRVQICLRAPGRSVAENLDRDTCTAGTRGDRQRQRIPSGCRKVSSPISTKSWLNPWLSSPETFTTPTEKKLGLNQGAIVG
jgi:hypothetical protein